MRELAARIEDALEELARGLGEVAVAGVPVGDVAAVAEALAPPGCAPGALLGEERALHARYRHPRRRAEFVAGRLAARKAAARALGLPGAALEIGRDASGAPRATGHPGLQLSISHAGSVAVAVAAPFAVGVDLERVAPRPDALARWFFSPAEQAQLAALPAAERDEWLHLLWTRKEAASKVGRWGGRLPFAALDCTGETVAILGRRVALRSARAAGYALSVAGEIGRG